MERQTQGSKEGEGFLMREEGEDPREVEGKGSSNGRGGRRGIQWKRTEKGFLLEQLSKIDLVIQQ